MDVVRVNLEEAIKAIQVVAVIAELEQNQIDWHSNGVPVDLIGLDTSIDLWTSVVEGNYTITPKIDEEDLTDE